MEKLLYYEILRNNDRTEDRGPMLSTGIGFKSKSEALRFVKSDIYAERYGVMAAIALRIADSIARDLLKAFWR